MPTMWGRDLWGSDIFGVAGAAAATAEIVPDLYLLELRDSSDDLVARLPFWGSGKWEQAANEPSRLTFTYPFTDAISGSLAFDNCIWLYDATGALVDRFRIWKRELTHDAGGAVTLVVTCEGLLGQLGSQSGLHEYGALSAFYKITLTGSPTGGTFTLTMGGNTTAAIAYDATAVDVAVALAALAYVGGVGNLDVTGDAGGPWGVRCTDDGTLAYTDIGTVTGSGAGLTGGSSPAVSVTAVVTGRAAETTVQGIVGDLINLQVSELPLIALGSIDASIGEMEIPDFRVEGRQTILAAIRKLADAAGGWFGVNTDGEFYWYAQPSAWTGQQIRMAKSMTSMTVSYDYAKLRTRVTVIGQGIDPEVRVEAVANDVTAQGTYGVIEEIVTDRDIWDTAQAQAKADSLIVRLATSEKVIRVSAIDLSRADCSRLDWSHAALGLGTRIRLVDSTLAEEFDTAITHITRDLAAPVAVTIEVSDSNAGNPPRRRRDLLDMLAEVEQEQRLSRKDILESIKDLLLSDGAALPNVARIFDADDTPLFKDGDFIRDNGLYAWENGEESQIITTAALRQCPDALLETVLESGSSTFTVGAGGQQKLPKNADAPFWLRVYRPADYNTYSLVPVSAVADRTYTISAGINCIQSIRLGLATGGTFVLTYSGQTTAAVAWNASAAAVDAALEALSNIGPGDVAVSKASNGWDVTFQGALANTDVATMTADGTNLTGDTTIEVWESRAGGTWTTNRVWNVGDYLKRVDVPEPSVCSIMVEGNSNDGGIQALLDAMDRCPDARLLANLASDGTTFGVESGGETNLPTNAECPFQIRLFNCDAKANDADYDVYELLSVSGVAGGVYTISARGQGDTAAANWAASTGIVVVSVNSVPEPAITICDLATGGLVDGQAAADSIAEDAVALETLMDALVDELVEALSENAAAEDALVTELAGTGIQPVDLAAADGTGDKLARVDHVHLGCPYDAAATTVGHFKYESNKLYWHTGTAWICLSHIV